MRSFVMDSAESFNSGGVDVSRWEQYSLGDALPFGAMWYSVPAGATSPRDCHPELELSVVLHGKASVEASGEITDVSAGSAFLLESGEAHIIHNRSGLNPVLIFTMYWMPREEGNQDSGAEMAASKAGE
jgi:quercetin dioxygenase-like cupin family protein